MNIFKRIFEKLRISKERRNAYVAAQIDVLIPYQIRALRKQYGLEQKDLAALADMKQPSISKLEKAGNRANIETLKRIANALDVALIVKFVPFTELARWSDNFSPDNFSVPNFSMELEQIEEQGINNNIFAMFGTSRTESNALGAPSESTARLTDTRGYDPQFSLPIDPDPIPYLKTADFKR